MSVGEREDIGGARELEQAQHLPTAWYHAKVVSMLGTQLLGTEHRPQTGRVHERQSAQVELDTADTRAAQAEDCRFQPRGHREVQLAAQEERMTAVAHALVNFKTGLTTLQGHVSVRRLS
jgi:hypothetical protein